VVALRTFWSSTGEGERMLNSILRTPACGSKSRRRHGWTFAFPLCEADETINSTRIRPHRRKQSKERKQRTHDDRREFSNVCVAVNNRSGDAVFRATLYRHAATTKGKHSRRLRCTVVCTHRRKNRRRRSAVPYCTTIESDSFIGSVRTVAPSSPSRAGVPSGSYSCTRPACSCRC